MIEQAIVQLRSAGGAVVGAGLATFPRGLVVTCAHVVSAALGERPDRPDAPDRPVPVRLLATGAEALARVVAWSPLGEHDVAVLEVDPASLPGLRPVPLHADGCRHGRRFRTYGFPEGYDGGRWGYGTFLHPLPTGLAQVESDDIAPGFSGGPVQDLATGKVAGIVSACDPGIAQAFVTPAEAVRALCERVEVRRARGPYEHLSRGLAGLPGDPLSGVEQFLEEYLGTPRRQVPFGGREGAFRELDAWLADPQSAYALVAEPAGRGKSALLTRWASAVAATGRAEVVFLPVSIRFGTSQKSTLLRMWGVRLRTLLGLEVRESDLTRDADTWLGEVGAHLREDRSPDDPPLLVLLDGLDEASDWVAGRDVRFPVAPGRGVKILGAARLLVDANTPAEWAERLGWPGETRLVRLPTLTREGVGDVLRAMGDPLARLHTDVDVLGKLHFLTEGEPFLVRLYVDALVGEGDRVAFLTPEKLDALKPGLGGFLQGWWDDQREQWRERRLDPDATERQVQALLYTLASALGPLRHADLARVAPPAAGLDDLPALRRTCQLVARFVVGEGDASGIVFSHPRLTQYFLAQMEHRADRAEWEARFVAYGEETLAALGAGTLAPEKVSPYLLLHHGAHLERTGAGVASFAALATDGWRRAWRSHEAGYAGFLADVDRLDAAAHAANLEALAEGRPAPWIAEVARCALCHASVNSLVENFSPALLRTLVADAGWEPAQAMAYAQRKLSSRGEALAAVARFLPEGVRAEVMEEVIGKSRLRKGAEIDRLAELSGWLTKSQLEHALRMVSGRAMLEERMRGLAALLPLLPEEIRADTLAEAVRDAKKALYEESRPEPVAWLLPFLPEPERTRILDDALAMSLRFSYAPLRVPALVALLPHVSEERRGEIAREAYAGVSLAGASRHDRQLILRIFSFLAPADAEAVLAEVGAVGSLALRAEYTSALAPLLPTARRAEVVRELARACLSDAGMTRQKQLDAVAHLIPCMDDAERRRAVDTVMLTAGKIGDQGEYAAFLAACLRHASRAVRTVLVDDVVRYARDMPTELRGQVLGASDHPGADRRILVAGIDNVAAKLSLAALDACLDLAEHLDGEERHQAESAAFKVATSLFGLDEISAMPRFVQRVSGEWHEKVAKAMLRALANAEARLTTGAMREDILSCVLAGVASVLPSQNAENQQAIVTQVFSMARRVPTHWTRARSHLIPIHPEEGRGTRAEQALLQHADDLMPRTEPELWIPLLLSVPAELRREMLARLFGANYRLYLRNRPLQEILASELILESEEPAFIYGCWRQILDSAKSASRADVLPGLAVLPPVHRKLGGDAAVDGVIMAVRDVVHWWP